MKRFHTGNSIHYVSTIQDFISKYNYQDRDDVFAICNYVSDKEAIEIVKNKFKNVFCYYPCIQQDIKLKTERMK